jgi:glutamate-ammonia-ligase adenylyltransferase
VREFFVRVGCDLTAALRDDTHDGSLYRVGVPAWPQTDGWLKACSLAEYAEHYAAGDNDGERRALTRARPVAGDADLGARFVAACQSFVYGDAPRTHVAPPAAVHASGAHPSVAQDFSPAHASSQAGATDIDALTEKLQLAYGARHAALRSTGTLAALAALAKAGVIPEPVWRELDHAYVFLRTAEHRAQLGLIDADDTQVERSKARVREVCDSIGRLVDW